MFKHIAAATALLIASSTTFAAQPNTFYAGADLGRTKVDGYLKRDTSAGAFLGYQLSDNFAVEGGYRRLADQDINLATGGGIAKGNARINQAHLSLIGSLPVSDTLSVYGRLGVNRLEAKISSAPYTAKDFSTKALYGAGVSYAISELISARVEVQKPASDATTVNAGLSFQF